MANTKQIIALDAAVTIEAAQAEGEKKWPAKFDATFYTGGAMNIAGYDLPVVIDLAGLGRGNVLVANLDHDATKRVGNFDVVNDGKSLVAKGTATAKTAARDEVVGSALEGYQWQASLEVNPHVIETLAKGKTTTVNGQTVTGPAYITRKGTLKGFGFVSHGADDNTTVAIAAAAASPKGTKKMKAEVKEWIKGRFPSVYDTIDAMSDDEVANWEADYEGREGARKPVDKKINGGDAVSNAMLEAKRLEQFEDLTANFLTSIHASSKTTDFLNSVADIKARAIDEGWTPDKYDTELLRASVPLARAPRGSVRDGAKLNERILQAALCSAGGLKNIENEFTDQELQIARDRFKHGIGFSELFKICAEANGHRIDGYQMSLDLQRAAFGQLPAMHASTGFSTYSLSGILGTSAYKFLLEGWGGGEQTWRDVTDIVSVRDFKTITQYKLSGTMKYEKVGPGGEIKHGTISEGSYTVKADTYGKMFAITREHLVNDDLNALAAIPRELGYGANEAFNSVFWTEWLSGEAGSFWTYTTSGAVTAANAVTAITTAEAKFFDMTKPNGEPLGVTPNVILTPNAVWRNAFNAIFTPVVTGGSTTVPAASSLQGMYKVVHSSYITNTAYTGYNATKWYLLCVRPGFAPIQTAFLNGQQSPMIESASADFNTLGVQMRGVHDFGCNLMESRAAVQGSGA